MRDLDIRKQLHLTELAKFHKDSTSLVVDELSLCNQESRIDIAVVNGSMSGWEIKSDRDTLSRLPQQILSYNKVFDYITVVTGDSYIDKIQQKIPDWWGIIHAHSSKSTIILLQKRHAQRNNSLCSLALCQLLWRKEALFILNKKGLLSKKVCKASKSILWQIIAENLSKAEVCSEVRGALKMRKNWRVEGPRKKGGDKHRPSPRSFDSRAIPIHLNIEL